MDYSIGQMSSAVQVIIEAVRQLPGLTVASHRFGGVEFKIGEREVGHIHRNGMVDIPFNKRIRDQLLAEDKAEIHHLLTDSGWISFYVRSAPDIQQAIWLYTLAYVATAILMQRQHGVLADGITDDALAGYLNELKLSPELHTIIDNIRGKRVFNG